MPRPRLLRAARLRQHLADKGIATAIYYPAPLHLPPALAYLEKVVQLFLDAGFDAEKAARSFRLMGYYLMGAVLDETAGYANGPTAAEPVLPAEQKKIAPGLLGIGRYFQESEREATLLRYLKALLEGQGKPPMHLHEEAREAGWSDEQILEAARATGAQAIHPGYGFLAENARFAEICRECKIEFIGPPVKAMAAVGDKVECKRLAKKAKVPTVPGSDASSTTFLASA